MRCPFCKADDTAVADTRATQGGFSIRRRRRCLSCGRRFTTFERAELRLPVIVKRSGDRCEYDRGKLVASMRLALRKRPVSVESVEQAADLIEQSLLALGQREVASATIGQLVLARLKELDQVACLRFASVYFNVENPASFIKLINSLSHGKT